MTPEAHFIIKSILWALACMAQIIVLIGHINKGNKDASIGWLAALLWCILSFRT
jgi:hypothetical protein